MNENATKNPEISGIRILGPDEKIVIQLKGELDGALYQAAAEQINDLLKDRKNRFLIVDGSVQIYVIKERDPSTKKVQIQDADEGDPEIEALLSASPRYFFDEAMDVWRRR